MSRWTLSLVALVLALGLVAPVAEACWDNTDALIIQLKKLDLNTEQLKDVFKFQKEHREVIVRAHKESLGCRYHENHHSVFVKKAVGVLTDAQFKKHTGRNRTKVEVLEHDNYQLRKKIEKLEKRIAELEAQIERRK